MLPQIPANLLTTPFNLFTMAPRQTGVTQKGLVFPTTIACAALPTVGYGKAANLTSSSNVCGGVFAPLPQWDSVLIDLGVVGQNAADTLTMEIGRVKAVGGIAEILASVVFTASSVTLATSLVEPFTGAAVASTTWRFMDATTITANSQLGDVLQALGGTSGNLSQLRLNVHDAALYYAVITALSDGGTRTTKVVCDICPIS